MEYDKAIKSGTLYQNKITDIGNKIRAAMLSAFGIVFFLCWAAVGYIREILS